MKTLIKVRRKKDVKNREWERRCGQFGVDPHKVFFARINNDPAIEGVNVYLVGKGGASTSHQQVYLGVKRFFEIVKDGPPKQLKDFL
jgi:hypothetical protein